MKIKNISGEPREYEENGVIYEFPFPAEFPTEVPDDVARKLLATKQFVEVGVETPPKEKSKKVEKQEVKEDDV